MIGQPIYLFGYAKAASRYALLVWFSITRSSFLFEHFLRHSGRVCSDWCYQNIAFIMSFFLSNACRHYPMISDVVTAVKKRSAIMPERVHNMFRYWHRLYIECLPHSADPTWWCWLAYKQPVTGLKRISSVRVSSLSWYWSTTFSRCLSMTEATVFDCKQCRPSLNDVPRDS